MVASCKTANLRFGLVLLFVSLLFCSCEKKNANVKVDHGGGYRSGCARTSDQLRRAVANNSRLPFEILQEQPVPEFSLADDELAEIFMEASVEHHGEHHGGTS